MSFWQAYRRTALANPTRPAVVDQQGETMSHGELLDAADRVAGGLGRLGIEPGAVLGVFLPNRVAWPVIALAATKAGVGVLGLNTRFRHAELNHLLSVAKVETVVVASDFLGLDGPALMSELDLRVNVIVADPAVSADQASLSAETVSIADLLEADSGDDRSAGGRQQIGFTTSGTTGFPKIAMHAQAQTLAHLDAVARTYDLNAESVNLAPLPLCGAFGYTSAVATLLAGGLVVAQETWDPDAAAGAIDEHGVTFCNGSDDMLIPLLASDRFNQETSWTVGGFGDFTNAAASALTAADAIGDGTLRLTGLYGSSEGFALMSAWSRDAPFDVRVKGGGYLIRPDMAVRCCDPETGGILANEQPGELQFRGPNLIEAYLNNAEATANAFTDDGWYRSGDLGYTVEPDERGHGGFVFLARLGDSLRLRGFLCDPAEIEAHLENHVLVELAQVVGVKQAAKGDVAVAFVRLDPDGANGVTEADLLAHCSTGLANYKRPARVIVVNEFPVTDGPNGVKIRKVDLREQAAQLLNN